ncbi:hypothetical protein [Microbacterium sp. NPDC055665]
MATTLPSVSAIDDFLDRLLDIILTTEDHVDRDWAILTVQGGN